MQLHVRPLGLTGTLWPSLPQPSCTGNGRDRKSQKQEERICCSSSTSGKAQFAGGSGTAEFTAKHESLLDANPVQLAAGWRAEAKRLRSQLNSYGVSGLLAYGLLNTLYYSGAFLVIWTYFAKVPKGLGWSELMKQFATVMSLTWAASQVTKVPRAAAALILAPVADGLLIFVQARCRLRTRRNAFAFLVALCLLLATIIFAGTLLFWV